MEFANPFDLFIIVCFINHSTALIVEQLTDGLLIYLLINHMNDWSIDLSNDWLINQLSDCLLIYSTDWSVDSLLIDSLAR